MADHTEDMNSETTEEETLAEKRKRHDETFKRAQETLRKYFEKVAREQKGTNHDR